MFSLVFLNIDTPAGKKVNFSYIILLETSMISLVKGRGRLPLSRVTAIAVSCYAPSARAEDRAIPRNAGESDPSATAGGSTAGRGDWLRLFFKSSR